MNKYPWELAPEWAQYATTDESGRGLWHARYPSYTASYAGRKNIIGGWESAGQTEIIKKCPYMEKRPES